MTSPAPRAVVFGCKGLRLTVRERALFRKADPWGFILFARNVESPTQLLTLTSELREVTGRDLPILIDQEGGRVQRLRSPFWRDWPPALDQCQHATDPARAMFLRGRLIAAELRACGLNVNCAPLADIATPTTHPILRNRCYGTHASEVIANARAMADGLLTGGCLPVLKHIPGHGRATSDSHLALPVVDSPVEELEQVDFAAFRALADLPLAMTAHLLYPRIDPAAPATLSSRMIQLIRDKIGFNGVLMTDDISMQALQGPVRTRAEAALAAGCDLVLHCNGQLAEMEELAECCPSLSVSARARSARAFQFLASPQEMEQEALEEEFRSLTRVLSGQSNS
ncbi:MAG: beta-N-acetylhexosaminidase [Roseinatronobacter sp.]